MLQLRFFFPTACRQDTPAPLGSAKAQLPHFCSLRFIPCWATLGLWIVSTSSSLVLLSPSLACIYSTVSLESDELWRMPENHACWFEQLGFSNAQKIQKSLKSRKWPLLRNAILSFHTLATCRLKSSGTFRFLVLEGIVWASFKDAHSSSSLEAFSFPYRVSYCLFSRLRCAVWYPFFVFKNRWDRSHDRCLDLHSKFLLPYTIHFDLLPFIRSF